MVSVSRVVQTRRIVASRTILGSSLRVAICSSRQCARTVFSQMHHALRSLCAPQGGGLKLAGLFLDSQWRDAPRHPLTFVVIPSLHPCSVPPSPITPACFKPLIQM